MKRINISVQSRLHRTLRRTGAYKAYAELAKDVSFFGFEQVRLSADEQPLGVYVYSPGVAERNILFTDRAAYFRDKDEWKRLEYEAIERTEWPREDKNTAETLTIRMNDSSINRLSFQPGDVFVAMRFFNRLISDTKERGPTDPRE